MPQLVLKKAISDQKDLSVVPNHCEESLINFLNGDNQGFNASISCQFSCQGSKAQEVLLNENFRTSSNYMRRGDGGLWASLSTTLQMWSNEECMMIAQKNCGALEKIGTFSQPKISSGDWAMNDKLTCAKDAPVVLSPFEKTIKTKNISNENKSTTQEMLEIKTTWLIDKTYNHDKKNYQLPPECKNKISGTFCYGDCITLDEGPFKELLSSPKPLGEDNYTICADDLVKKLKNKNLSQDVVNFYCEDYFISNLKALNATGLTCASSRISVNCSNLKDSL